MKHLILILSAVLLTACKNDSTPQPEHEASWNAFCQVYGYEPTDTTGTFIDRFLDTWKGSALEDSILDSHE